jgi:hypothetical protein
MASNTTLNAKSVNTNDLCVTETLARNNGPTTKWYSKNYTNISDTGSGGDSIGVLATGFDVGHYVTNTMIEIRTGEEAAVDGGAVIFEIGTAAQGAHDGGAGTAITGGAQLTATTAAGKAQAHPTATNAFSDTNNTLCVSNANTAAALTTSDFIRVYAEVTASPGSPALP